MNRPATATGLHSALRGYLAAPDAVLPLGRAPDPMSLAAAAAVGLAGLGLFAALAALGTCGGVTAAGASRDPLTAVLIPPISALLCFPPLYLLVTMQGRRPGFMRLAAVASAGPTVAGVWLGASAPVLLLYLLTGEVDWAFRLLTAGLALLAVAAGAGAALRNARRAGPSAPGGVAVLAHYFLAIWTALVLARHLL